MNKKHVALVVGALSAVYVFIPEPSDLVPILGWIDEGLALALFSWSMRTLGVRLPWQPAVEPATAKPPVALQPKG